MNKEIDPKYIFFIQLKTKFPKEFFHLNKLLKDLSIDLIPITPDDFKNIILTKNTHIISLVDNLESKGQFLKFKVEFLDKSVRNKSLVLHHISSFGPANGLNIYTKQGFYYYYSLPANIQNLICQIANRYNQSEFSNKWMGGKRTKLPQVG